MSTTAHITDDSMSLHESLLDVSINEESNGNAENTDEDEVNSNGSDGKDIVLAVCCFRDDKTIRVNHNVFLNLLLALFYGVSGSLWNGTAYAAYLKQLGHNRNGPVGDIEAVNGLASLLTALPVGYLADKIGRSKIIAFGGILLLLTSILQIIVLQWAGTEEEKDQRNETTTLITMGVIMAFWGVGDGIVNGPASALYADSTPEGKRSMYYNYLFAIYMVASSVGPLVSIILFQTLGDVWDLYHLRLIIYVGMGIEIFNSLLMMLFDDDKALEESSDPDESDSPAETLEETPLSDNSTTEEASPCCSYNPKWIPYIIFVQGLVLAIGSGMTIKFFPLFFKDEVGMSPSQVQIVYCVVPFVMVITSTLGSKLAACGFGRVQTTLLFNSLGVSLLFCMVFFKKYLDTHPFVLVPIYVLRTSLMNATYPLTESILMDFVPKEERARWKSLDSVASFGWCGSAALGGMVADKYDYTHTFLITAIIQSIGIGIWAFLLPLVPRNEGERPVGTEQDTSSSLEEPLLPGA